MSTEAKVNGRIERTVRIAFLCHLSELPQTQDFWRKTRELLRKGKEKWDAYNIYKDFYVVSCDGSPIPEREDDNILLFYRNGKKETKDLVKTVRPDFLIINPYLGDGNYLSGGGKFSGHDFYVSLLHGGCGGCYFIGNEGGYDLKGTVGLGRLPVRPPYGVANYLGDMSENPHLLKLFIRSMGIVNHGVDERHSLSARDCLQKIDADCILGFIQDFVGKEKPEYWGEDPNEECCEKLVFLGRDILSALDFRTQGSVLSIMERTG